MLSLADQNRWREKYRREHAGWQPATEVFAELVRTHFQANTRLLDLGCGRGGLVEQLQFFPSQIIGLDPDWDSLHSHRLIIPRVQGGSRDLPFAAASFDMIMASWVMEHLEQPLAALQGIHRVLKPGGVFIFITPNSRHPIAVLNHFFGRFSAVQIRIVRALYGRRGDDTFSTYYRANTENEVSCLAHQSGFTAAQFYLVPDPTYLAFSATMYRASCWLEARLPTNRKIHLIGILTKT